MRHPPRPVCLALLAASIGGCATPTPPPTTRPTDVTFTATAYAGTALGPTSQPTTTRSATTRPSELPVGIEVSWIAVARMPTYALLPLDAQSSLTTSPLSGAAVLTAGRQTRRARFGANEAADDLLARLRSRRDGAAQQIGHQVVPLAPGHTARVQCDVAGQAVQISFARPIAPPATVPTTDATLDYTPGTTPGTTPDATPVTPMSAAGTITVGLRGFPAENDDAPVDVPESAWLNDQDLSPGARFALLVPCRFADGPWTALAAYVDVTDADAARSMATTRPTTRPAGTQPAGISVALRSATVALKSADDPRPPLLYMATLVNATIAADALLVATGGPLATLGDAVVTDVNALPGDATTDTARWAIDRAVLLALCGEAEKAPLPPELSAVLVVHAGEVGRHPDALAELVKAVGSESDLQDRLVGENWIALEDNSPAARVRAFDWLTAAGRAPADFDPLADGRTRRRAINRALGTNGAAR